MDNDIKKLIEYILESNDKNREAVSDMRVQVEINNTKLDNHIEYSKKLDTVIEKVVEQLSIMNRSLDNYNIQLENHIKRTELLEEAVTKLKTNADISMGKLIESESSKKKWFKYLTVCMSIVTMAGTIIGILKHYTGK